MFVQNLIPQRETVLSALGSHETVLDRAATLALEKPYWNPRPLTREAMRALLRRASAGEPPQ